MGRFTGQRRTDAEEREAIKHCLILEDTAAG